MGYTITLAVGSILLFFSLKYLTQSLSFIKKNERTIATVVELEEVRDSDGISFKPVFKFYTNDKKEVYFRHSVSSSPPAWKIGDQNGVSYDINAPSKAPLLTSFGAFGASIVLMALAMPMLVIGGGYYLSKNLLG